jgi:undecaprenyl-diphosphatase
MPLYQAVILAIVQGFTEFLPVSSTAHLILFPWLAGWTEPGLAFDVALHTGTLVAVGLYFLRTWVELALCGLGMHYPASASADQVQQHRRFFWYMVVGTIPAGLAGFFFHHIIEEELRKPLLIGIAMVAIGLLMWWAERTASLNRQMENSNLGDAVVIGTAQAVALFPGVSRSGITISAGLWRGLTRQASARFSFILSTPVIAGAALTELPKLLRLHKAAGGLELPLSTLLISIAVSALVGYLVIAFFLRYLQTRTLQIFIVYRIVFGIVVLLLVFLQMGHAR